MVTLRIRKKLAVVDRDSQKENPRNSSLRDTIVLIVNEDYIAQVSGRKWEEELQKIGLTRLGGQRMEF